MHNVINGLIKTPFYANLYPAGLLPDSRNHIQQTELSHDSSAP